MYDIKYQNIDFGKNGSNQLSLIADSVIDNIERGVSYYQIFKKQDPEIVIKSIAEMAKKISHFSELIVISMGGATLNPSMLVRFLGQKSTTPKIHFLNNTDPIFFSELINSIDIKNTAILAISNSGNTMETNSLTGCMLYEYKKNGITNLKDRCFFITDIKKGTLKDIATKIDANLISHQVGISGRYSGLSNISILIGLIAGIDIENYILGANNVIDDFYFKKAESMAVIGVRAIAGSDKNILVNVGYLQKFDIFLEWYSQVIAESLGKEGGGYTPVRGLGPNDQHSMFQLYLDGPKDKLFSLFYSKHIEQDIYKTDDLNELGYLSNRNLLDINLINFNATLSALDKKKLPIRSIVLDDISAKSFGAITCHLMLEVVVLGHVMNINPFDQPAVELIKKESAIIAPDIL